MSVGWQIDDDYDIKILDDFSGQYISLSTEEFCAVRFDGVGSPDLREAVYDVSGGDGVHFGREYFGAINWTITGSIFGGNNRRVPGDSDTAWNTWSNLSRAWINYPERKLPRAVKPLYFQRPGREQMMVFGRPGRIDPDTKSSHSGFITYTAAFRQSDPRFFAAEEKFTSVRASTAALGGLLLNPARDALYVPFVTSLSDARFTGVTNNGDVPTSPMITFTGPVTNPYASLTGPEGQVWRVGIRASIPANVNVTIDARQWARYVTASSNANYSGVYDGPRLQELTIPPGQHTLSYSGTDQTGTSQCQIRYRNAWSST